MWHSIRMNQKDQRSEPPRPPPRDDSRAANASRRNESQQWENDLDAVALSAWRRIQGRHPDCASWTTAHRIEEYNTEIRLLGDLSYETRVLLRIRLDYIATKKVEKLGNEAIRRACRDMTR